MGSRITIRREHVALVYWQTDRAHARRQLEEDNPKANYTVSTLHGLSVGNSYRTVPWV
jgi:hypothetical protein